MSEENGLSIIDGLDMSGIGNTVAKINQFQTLVQQQLKQGQDFGTIPGTTKATLLKPGAEKINMLMGLTSKFEILDSTRNFESGFFQYQVRCSLYKNGICITEGLGSGNTKEKKYIKQDAFTMDNTVLKMAKKRAFVDATLLVGSLSDIFTQDMEDVDLNGVDVTESSKKVYTDNGAVISQAQAKRIFGISKGNSVLVKEILLKYKYINSADVKKIDYENICNEIIAAVENPLNATVIPLNNSAVDVVGERLPWDLEPQNG